MSAPQPPYGPAYGQPAHGQPAHGQPAHGQPAYGQPAYGPAYGQPAYGPGGQPRPRPTSTRGPKITFFAGVGALVVAIALGVVAAATFWNTLPTDVLRLDGSPGSEVLGTVTAPGSAEVTLPESRAYALYLVGPADSPVSLDGPISVTDPGGADVPVDPSPVSSTVTMGSTRAVAVGVVQARAPGVFLVQAPATTDGATAAVYVVESAGLGSFLGGVFGTVAAAIAAGLLGMAALALLVTGGIMWGIRRGNARSAGSH